MLVRKYYQKYRLCDFWDFYYRYNCMPKQNCILYSCTLEIKVLHILIEKINCCYNYCKRLEKKTNKSSVFWVYKRIKFRYFKTEERENMIWSYFINITLNELEVIYRWIKFPKICLHMIRNNYIYDIKYIIIYYYIKDTVLQFLWIC